MYIKTTPVIDAELPFNGQAGLPVFPPKTKDLIRYIIKGWTFQNRPRPEDRPQPVPRSWLPAFIIIMSKPDWKTIFRQYAELGLRQDHESETLQRVVRRMFNYEHIEDDLSNEIADMALLYLTTQS